MCFEPEIKPTGAHPEDACDATASVGVGVVGSFVVGGAFRTHVSPFLDVLELVVVLQDAAVVTSMRLIAVQDVTTVAIESWRQYHQKPGAVIFEVGAREGDLVRGGILNQVLVDVHFFGWWLRDGGDGCRTGCKDLGIGLLDGVGMYVAHSLIKVLQALFQFIPTILRTAHDCPRRGRERWAWWAILERHNHREIGEAVTGNEKGSRSEFANLCRIKVSVCAGSMVIGKSRGTYPIISLLPVTTNDNNLPQMFCETNLDFLMAPFVELSRKKVHMGCLVFSVIDRQREDERAPAIPSLFQLCWA